MKNNECNLYYEVCKIFDLVAEGKTTIDTLERIAHNNNIDLSDFCDANDLGVQESWETAINEYNNQIANYER